MAEAIVLNSIVRAWEHCAKQLAVHDDKTTLLSSQVFLHFATIAVAPQTTQIFHAGGAGGGRTAILLAATVTFFVPFPWDARFPSLAASVHLYVAVRPSVRPSGWEKGILSGSGFFRSRHISGN
jgi:hypothetical protein